MVTSQMDDPEFGERFQANDAGQTVPSLETSL